MSEHQHRVPLLGLFAVLLALTGAEVALFEIWSRNQWLMPKYAMVLLLLLFTLPKAAIVLIYFMHLRFERQLVVTLALIPFVVAAIAVLPILSDIMTLKDRSYNQVEHLREFGSDQNDHHGPGDETNHGTPASEN